MDTLLKMQLSVRTDLVALAAVGLGGGVLGFVTPRKPYEMWESQFPKGRRAKEKSEAWQRKSVVY